MAEKVTKVIYDVEQAIKNLNKLNKTVEESGEVAENSFEEGGQAASLFQDVIGKLPGPIGSVATKLSSLSGATGLLAGGVAAAGLAVGGLVSNLIGLPELLRDSRAEMDAFNQAADRALDIANNLSAEQDALANATLRRAQDENRLQRSRIQEEQVAADQIRRILQDQAKVSRETFRDIERALKTSVDRRRRLQDRLRERQLERVGDEFAGQDADVQAANLLEKARLEAQQGNLEVAERLVEKAEALEGDLKNQFFFTEQLAEANKAIDASLQSQIDAADENVSRGESILETQREILNFDQQRLEAQQEITQELSDQRKELRAQSQQIGVAAAETVRAQERDQASREIETAATKLRQEFTRGSRSVAQNVRDSFSQSINNLREAGVSDAAGDAIAQGLEGFVKAAANLEQGLQAGTATFADAQQLTATLNELNAQLGAVEAAIAGRGLAGLEATVEQTRGFLDAGQDISRAIQRAFQADARPGTRIGEGIGVDSPFQRFLESASPPLERIGDASTQAADGLSKVAAAAERFNLTEPTGGGGVATAAPATTTPATAAVAAAPANVTVNVTIRGGMLDRETVDQITEIIKLEVRKATSSGV